MTGAHSADPRADARAAYELLDDGVLASWDVVREMHDWSVLLLGNGASLSIWERFGYHSLYDTALESGSLTDGDQAVFEALSTGNFEAVLAALRTAEVVTEALELDSDELRGCYESIRKGLVDAVHAVHIPWVEVADDTLSAIKAHVVTYDYVFTTNYDLLLYWAIMTDDARGVCDFFWNSGQVFDPLNVDVWHKVTKVLFLHGGLHLLQMSDGQTKKRSAVVGANLLDLFGEPLAEDPDAVPLFVSEGEASDKLAAIRRSNYLTFALTQFAERDQPLVAFGHSLSQQDRHLFDLLRRRRTPIAVSLRDGDRDTNSARMAEMRARFHGQELVFFDAASHPLGRPEFAVPTA